ncbi:CGNR zinc finger domain-containing protein [Nonomuraea jabiensis]|uniref:Putative RNA-binding Zn ribbon-like protein n=1 Tax=Nonomuraea jabiensis TaxID=882448 RepID=A0A7W9LIR1_9ACTN|nr:ABATE domain-containing protein [Nonomuraea jabiensis]MBB5785305.1 putative RNA-binding Zn ribbon-like protein [Nonomuraea jabiensis]
MSLTLEFVSTLRAERSGLVDRLADPDGMTAWVRTHVPDLADLTVTEELRQETVRLRQAVRALFARAVAPGPPSRADAASLPAFEESLALVNATALAAPTAPQLRWDGEPSLDTAPATQAGPGAQLLARLATAAVEFLAGPDRALVRTCQAPRCVLYFVKEHPRQEWCSTGCGNRARAARHYREHKKI